MSSTAGAGESRDGDGPAVEVVPAVGFLVAAAATVGPLLSLRQGVAEPPIWAATAAAGLATLAFFGRRHGALDRRTAAPLAAVASGFAALLTGYAIATGIADAVVVPGVGWSLPVVFASFFAAGAAVGVAVADYGGVSGAGLQRRGAHFLELFVLGFLGFAAYVTAAVLLRALAVPITGELSPLQARAIGYVGLGVGFAAVAVGYLSVRDRDLSYIDLAVPSPREVLWIVGGVIGVYGASVGLTALLVATGAEQATHATIEEARQNAEILVVVIPSMLLIVGPGEEILFRNVIQKSLYETFSRYGAVAVASVIFAAVHISAYAAAGSGQVLVSLVITFALSLVLGTIYERTENVVIPALVHGFYNVGVFLPLLL